MLERNSQPVPPVRPQPSHTSIVFHQTQKRYAQRPINHFPWKEFHLKMSSQGYVVGSDWAMTTFDNRTDDQFFDSKRLQTIDEGAEVRFFQPYEPLDYSHTSEIPDSYVLQEIRHLDLRRRKGFSRRLFIETKNAMAQVGLKICDFCRLFFGCL